jgi:PAS domain S-box-containing protein
MKWPELPFILYTGEGSEDIAEQAIAAGVTDYVQKKNGFNEMPILVNRIRNAVSHYEAERQLAHASQRTEAQFDMLVDAVSDYAIFFLDRDGYIQTWNTGAERIKGYSKEEIIGEHFSLFYRDEDRDAGLPEQNLQQAIKEGYTNDAGWRVRKDGSKFWADVGISAVEGDGLIGFVKVTRENTQHMEQQELIEQKELLDDIIMAISHDLRSPLTVVRGHIELARETEDFNRLDAAEDALDRTVELLDYLRTLAQEGREVYDLGTVSIRETAEDAWDVTQAEEASLSVEDEFSIMADRPRLQQLLENLFGNAIQHAGPHVTVTVGRLDDRHGFYVEDDGLGIPEADHLRIFEVGFSKDEDGTGFGLAISRRIVEAHGWEIRVFEGSSGGARFEISDVTFADSDQC